MEFISNSVQETISFGKKIGSSLKGGEVFAICGQLGTGKTHLIKGIAHGAGCESCEQVNSPTFVIVNEYSARLDIFHIDAYRLESVAEFEMVGFDDFCNPDSVVLIEWADKVAAALKNVAAINIELFYKNHNKRSISVKNAPSYLKL